MIKECRPDRLRPADRVTDELDVRAAQCAKVRSVLAGNCKNPHRTIKWETEWPNERHLDSRPLLCHRSGLTSRIGTGHNANTARGSDEQFGGLRACHW